MNSARYQFVSVMGAWMAAAGIEHGVGEFLQGNVPPEGLIIRSWPDSAFFQSLNGEPALTILPSLQLTGIMAIAFSLLFAGWAIFFVRSRYGGLVMMLLTVPMLLFGGGIFPPVLGLLIGAAATRFHASASEAPVTGIQRTLGQLWRWVFPACCAAWLALFPGVAALHYFMGIDADAITLAVLVTAILLLFLAYYSGLYHDRLWGRAIWRAQ